MKRFLILIVFLPGFLFSQQTHQISTGAQGRNSANILVVSFPQNIQRNSVINVTIHPTEMLSFAELVMPNYDFLDYSIDKPSGVLYISDEANTIVWKQFNSSQDLNLKIYLSIKDGVNDRLLKDSLNFDVIFTFFKNGKRGEIRKSMTYLRTNQPGRVFYLSQNQ